MLVGKVVAGESSCESSSIERAEVDASEEDCEEEEAESERFEGRGLGVAACCDPSSMGRAGCEGETEGKDKPGD